MDPSKQSSGNFDFQDFPVDSTLVELDTSDQQTHTFKQFPDSAVDDDLEGTVEENKLLGEEKPAGGGGAIWTVEYYRRYFNVDTSDVRDRCLWSMVPKPGTNFLKDRLQQNPDLYGGGCRRPLPLEIRLSQTDAGSHGGVLLLVSGADRAVGRVLVARRAGHRHPAAARLSVRLLPHRLHTHLGAVRVRRLAAAVGADAGRVRRLRRRAGRQPVVGARRGAAPARHRRHRRRAAAPPGTGRRLPVVLFPVAGTSHRRAGHDGCGCRGGGDCGENCGAGQPGGQAGGVRSGRSRR
ncbi:uncharacterized protein LOC122381980 isoform X2 [Amphibalanus amphitrite]|uniref:uncharacterized protein LOC122381980 isoform X2 n=1 Tax=Amphibalanus amphitrite TaxID=1232801 RepID=UPI001C903BAD|nr:uncharacterized protein LOC122381980 isoform X2 [Amphibalanus amphitrite]